MDVGLESTTTDQENASTSTSKHEYEQLPSEADIQQYQFSEQPANRQQDSEQTTQKES